MNISFSTRPKPGSFFLYRIGIIVSVLLLQSLSLATIFDIEGEVITCDDFACGQADISVGDQITGNLVADDAFSGPNSTFIGQDIISVEIAIGAVGGGVVDGPFDNAQLSTDGDGEIVSGTAQFSTDFETIFGTATINIDVDATLGTWIASTTFLNIGEVATGILSFVRRVELDFDNDGIIDALDNCTLLANADQRDSNNDGYGNVCDPDINNDGAVNFLDTAAFAMVFGSAAGGDADFNGDGFVNFIDFAVLAAFIFGPPGPSGIVGP